jgi:putative ABC transport system permease protein
LIGTLLLSNAIFGALVLALSGLIVFNVLTALLSGQRRQIGVMKALGGSRTSIAGLYLLEAGILGAAGVAVALPIGVAGGRAISAWMASLVNFDLIDWAAPPWAFALACSVGIGVPVASALIPVWLGTRASPRDAIASAGAGSRAFGSSHFDRMLARIPGGNSSFRMALRNLGRNRLRTALTMTLLVLAGIFCMAALDVQTSLMRTVDRMMAQDGADAAISLDASYPAAAVEAAVGQSPDIAAAEGWVEAEAFMTAREGRLLRRDSVRVSGVPRGSRTLIPDMALGGRLDGNRDGIVVNTMFHEKAGKPAIGSALTISIGGRESSFRLLGVQYDAFGVSTAWIDRGFFAAEGGAEMANSLRIVYAAGRESSGALAAADMGLKAAGMRSASETTKVEKRIVMDEHMSMIFVFLLVVSAILGGTGLLGIYTTVGIGISERRRELGVMRAIGATPGRTALIVVEEAICAGLLSWAIASAAALPLGREIGAALLRLILNIRSDIGIALDPLGVAAWLVLSLAGCAAASLRPALAAARFPVRDALSYE